MKHLNSLPRWLLGLVFFIFGLNGFLQFIPVPPMPEQAGQFMGGLAGSGYFFPFLKGTEVLMGTLLLLNLWVPLALTILAPIVINIFLFHLFLAPDGMGMSIVLVALTLTLAWQNRKIFGPFFEKRSTSV